MTSDGEEMGHTPKIQKGVYSKMDQGLDRVSRWVNSQDYERWVRDGGEGIL